MWKAEIRQKLGLLHQTVSQIVKAKERFLKETKSATPVTARVIRKRNSRIAGREEVLVVWAGDQARYNIPLSQSPLQSKAPLSSIL